MTKKTVVTITIPVFLIIVAVAAMAALRVRRSLTTNTEYFTQIIEEGPLQKVINATGSVQTVVTVPVGSQVSGQVQELFADFNSVVKRGQLLAKLDPRNLEAAVANKPNYPSSQLSLGKLYLLDGQTAEALTCLEKALALNPRDPAVYAALASAYRKAGDTEKAQATLAKLAELNHAQAEKIRTGTGETKASYGGTASQHP